MSKNVKVHRHLQTGTRLVEPADDVGESSKLSKINGTLKTNAARIQILQNALSFTQAQDGAMANVGHMIKRVSHTDFLGD
jgi:flagellin-like hook-associated protein FlgL